MGARAVCRTDLLFHYLLKSAPESVHSILRSGLHPLSRLVCERLGRVQEDTERTLSFYERIYQSHVEPVLGRPFPHSGVFLTPIDFRLVPSSFLAQRGRFRIPLRAVDPSWTVVSYEWKGRRVVERFSRDALGEASRLWTRKRVEEQFGRDPTMLFYYVPQVATYQPGGIAVEPEWYEPASRLGLRRRG